MRGQASDIRRDYETVHAGMKSDKHMPGLTEEEFINKYGFGRDDVYGASSAARQRPQPRGRPR